MIDIHAHILPGMDDGAADWDSALSMAELAVKSGVSTLVATPHCGLPGQEPDGRLDDLREQLALFQAKLEQAGLRLTVCEGMEIFGTPETAELLEQGLLTTLNRSRYPLIEFPFSNYSRQATHILEEVLALGCRPVVAHPERYQYTQYDPSLLNLWADMGCLLQLNRGSLLGRFGPAAEELAWAMLERGFVCTIASDAHSPRSRTTWMKDVRELLRDEYSESTARLLLDERPARLLGDKPIDIPEPNWF